MCIRDRRYLEYIYTFTRFCIILDVYYERIGACTVNLSKSSYCTFLVVQGSGHCIYLNALYIQIGYMVLIFYIALSCALAIWILSYDSECGLRVASNAYPASSSN